MKNNDGDDKKRISNARLALLIALIPILLFVAAFFIRR